MVNKYRRIEVNAFRRRVTIVSGEWPSAAAIPPPFPTDDSVSLNDADACEPVEPASPEGQQILVEAVRSLERRLSPETRAAIRGSQDAVTTQGKNRSWFYFKLQTFYWFVCPRALRCARRER
jgi:hypothetical protein